jgi:hypothetical protein
MTKLPFWLARNHMAARESRCRGCRATHKQLWPIRLYHMERTVVEPRGLKVCYTVVVRCDACGHEAFYRGEGIVSEKLAHTIEGDQ